jgi:hypothetical protein
VSTGSAREDGAALLTLSEAAAIFGVEPATVARWARAGKLTFVAGNTDVNGEHYLAEWQVRALINGDRRPLARPAVEAAQASRMAADPLGVERALPEAELS